MPPTPLSQLRRYVSGDTPWRETMWNRWLVSYLSPAAAPSPSNGQSSPVEGEVVDSAPAKQSNGHSGSANHALGPDSSQSNSSLPEQAPDLTNSGGQRFQALMDRLLAVEEQLETLFHRLLAREQNERRSAGRLSAIVERVAAAAEQQNSSLDSLLGSMDRLDARLMVLEGRLRSQVPPARGSTLPQDFITGTLRPPPPVTGIGASEIPGPLSHPPERRASLAPGRSVLVGPTVSGKLPEMSLATVLSLFELEQRTGWLIVESSSGESIRLELHRGVVVASALNGANTDPVRSLRDALSWQDGKFSYRDVDVMPSDGPRRSLNSLLLQATCQMDEEAR